MVAVLSTQKATAASLGAAGLDSIDYSGDYLEGLPHRHLSSEAATTSAAVRLCLQDSSFLPSMYKANSAAPSKTVEGKQESF